MAKLWAIVAGIGAILGSIFLAFTKGSKAKADEIAADLSERAKEVSEDAHQEIIEGMKKQGKVKNESVDPDRRDYFE